jgi:hypothetical protein
MVARMEDLSPEEDFSFRLVSLATWKLACRSIAPQFTIAVKLAQPSKFLPEYYLSSCSPVIASGPTAIHTAIHNNDAYDVLPMTCGAVRALPCR